jgi:hypothetical protein
VPADRHPTARVAPVQRAVAVDLGMPPDEAAVGTGIDRAVVDRVLARAAGVAWKHAVPHALS